MRRIEGTKQRDGFYHLNLRIPAEAVSAFGGKSHLRRSLRTADPAEALRQVTLEKARIIEAVQRARQRDTLSDAVEALPPDQRQLYDEAGGLEGLLRQYAAHDKARAFMTAGGAVIGSDTQVAGVKVQDGRVYLLPQVSSSGERTIAEAGHKAELTALDRIKESEAKTLRALGEDVPTSTGLRELLRAYVKAKGTGDQTAEAMGGVVGRFIELHGDVAVEDLTITHLREYVAAIEGLPAVTSSNKLRGQKLLDLLTVGRAEGLRSITDVTRARHVSMLKALTAFAPGQGYLLSDPWAAYKFIAAKKKHSAKKSRAPFTGDQVALVLQEAARQPVATIDHWAPLLAAYQGARKEEIGQLTGADVFEEGGVWVMRITDEGDGQKVKNAASFRTIPLHKEVLRAGFHDFAASRPKGEFLFREAARWGGKLHPMRADARGRLTEPFGKRFSRRLREGLGITDRRLTFHSFRHAWEDAAEDVDMPQTHRRELAGRSKAGDSQAGYGNGPRLEALRISLNKLDPLKL